MPTGSSSDDEGDAPTADQAATKPKLPWSPSGGMSQMQDSYGYANVAIMG